MIEPAYFFDTYAFFEILKDNPHYTPYRYTKVLTTQFNIAEFYWALLREKRSYAEDAARHRATASTPVTLDDIIAAMQLRVMHPKLSIPDAIGYTVAKRHGVKFLTGDKEFEKMDNVEFVK